MHFRKNAFSKNAFSKNAQVLVAQQKGIQDGTIDEDIYAEDFRFCAPFVGGATPRTARDREPGLTKKQYFWAQNKKCT